MSQENVELAQQALDAFNRRDRAAFLALWDEDAEIVAGGVVMEGDYQGRAGIRRFWENLLDVLGLRRRGCRSARPRRPDAHSRACARPRRG
jgi:ketosteroid isomerase-like protein